MTDLNRLFKWLAILSTLIALFVFLFSIVSPFYRIAFGSLEPSGSTYWSYKADQYFEFFSHQSWFFRYWSDDNNPSYLIGFWAAWILIAMFVIQILTLAFGAACLFVNRRIILSVPLCSSLTVLALMSYLGYRLSPYNTLPYYNLGEYQLGYYLLIPSVILFAFAFILNEERTRRWQP